jgi:hypothetical protein
MAYRKLKKGQLIKLFTGPKKVLSDAMPNVGSGTGRLGIKLMDLRSGVHQWWDYDCVLQNATELTELDIILYVKKEFL